MRPLSISDRVLTACLVLGFAGLVFSFALLFYLWEGPIKADRARPPLCFQTEGPELEGFTPAHVTEKEVVGNMRHTFSVSLRCRGTIDGRFVEFKAEQVWIARTPGAGMTREAF